MRWLKIQLHQAWADTMVSPMQDPILYFQGPPEHDLAAQQNFHRPLSRPKPEHPASSCIFIQFLAESNRPQLNLKVFEGFNP